MVVLFLLMGVLFVGLGWPLYKGKVKPNNWYGLRVGETMANEQVWYAANAYCGRDFVVLGAIVSLLAVLLSFVFSPGDDAYALIMCVLVTVGALALCGRGMAVARKYHRIFVEGKQE